MIFNKISKSRFPCNGKWKVLIKPKTNREKGVPKSNIIFDTYSVQVPIKHCQELSYTIQVNVNTISKQSCSLFSLPDRIVSLHDLLILLLGSANSVRWFCCLLKSLLDSVLWRIIAHIVLPLDVLLSARLYDTLCWPYYYVSFKIVTLYFRCPLAADMGSRAEFLSVLDCNSN